VTFFDDENVSSEYVQDMRLRDYFAAKALAGMLADSTLYATPDEFAERSYQLADAMLKARGE